MLWLLVHNNDAGTVSVTCIVSRKNLYVLGQNAFLNVQNFDNLICWTLEMNMYTRNVGIEISSIPASPL